MSAEQSNMNIKTDISAFGPLSVGGQGVGPAAEKKDSHFGYDENSVDRICYRPDCRKEKDAIFKGLDGLV